VDGITPLLTEPGKVNGRPYKLRSNIGKSFQGSIVLGMGFVLSQEAAAALINRNPKNKDCLFPYLNGEDLNSRPDQSPSRFVINFFDWPLNRLGPGNWHSSDDKQRKLWLRTGIVPADYPKSVAADFPDLLEIVEREVMPEREKLKDDGGTQSRRKKFWWQFASSASTLYESISDLGRYLIHPFTGKHNNFSFFEGRIVASHMTVVFAFEGWEEYALLQSEIHWKWALEFGNKLETRPQYNNTDCFETFPLPLSYLNLYDIGKRYYEARQDTVKSRQIGLTKLYNLMHMPSEANLDVIEMRLLQVEMDKAVAAAYGWEDLFLDHGFHETKQGVRYTISESARCDVLDRLLALNHMRHGEEEEAERLTMSVTSSVKRGRKAKELNGQTTFDL
jgi:hypothetical protein